MILQHVTLGMRYGSTVAIVMGEESPSDAVIDWLMHSDPSIRWQVMRDVSGASEDAIAAERSRVAHEGWGARLLDQQRADGQWGDGVAVPFWWSNVNTLVFLRDLGVDPTSARARAAIDRVRSVSWGAEFGESPFFEGEVEPCINGRVVALGAYFNARSDRLVDRLCASSSRTVDGIARRSEAQCGRHFIRRSACSKDCSHSSKRSAPRLQ